MIVDPVSKDKQYAIICNGLTKSYGSQIAVDSITLKIRYGSIFGLLGPNGAGKTSIIKMLTGLSAPTNGKAFVADYNVANETTKVKQNIGWVSSEVILDESLNAMENIWLQSKLQGVGRKWKYKALDLLRYFELDEKNNKKVGQFSTGMKKKLEIIMALIHEPKILFMDEPTIGLDANTRKLFWNLIKKINKIQGVTILLTTHYIEEADALCDDLAIINHGKIIATGSPEQLKSMAGEDRLEIEFYQYFDYSFIRSIEGVKSILEEKEEKGEEEGKFRTENPLKLSIKVQNAETILPELISSITRFHSKIIKSIRIEKPNLESIFLELTGKRIKEAEETINREY